jgi:hypothetical protein
VAGRGGAADGGRAGGVDRKTARRYVEAAVLAGLARDGGAGQLSDELVGQVAEAVRPVRPGGHGQRVGREGLAGHSGHSARHLQLRRAAPGSPDPGPELAAAGVARPVDAAAMAFLASCGIRYRQVRKWLCSRPRADTFHDLSLAGRIRTPRSLDQNQGRGSNPAYRAFLTRAGESNPAYREAYAKPNLKKYKPMACPFTGSGRDTPMCGDG